MKSENRGIATLHDVAKRAGVSRSAASVVLNGAKSTVGASQETRQRILQAAAELRYHPNAVARGLVRGRMNTIGIGVDSLSVGLFGHSFYGPAIQGIFDVALRENQFITFFHGEFASGGRISIAKYCDGRSDGLLLISPATSNDVTSALLQAMVPFVLVGDQSDDPRVSSADVDNVTSTKELITHLLQLGHRRIAVLSWRDINYSISRRFVGYREALADQGIPYDESLVLWSEWVKDGIFEGVEPLLRDIMSLPASRRPTAFFGINDQIALHAMDILKEMGFSIPGDISIVGFDDIPAAAAVHPALTTVRQNFGLTGSRATELLLSQIENPDLAGRKEFVPTELIIRDSSAPPPGTSPR